MRIKFAILGLCIWAFSASSARADLPPPPTFVEEVAREPGRVILAGLVLAIAIGSAGYFLFRRRRGLEAAPLAARGESR